MSLFYALPALVGSIVGGGVAMVAGMMFTTRSKRVGAKVGGWILVGLGVAIIIVGEVIIF